MFQFAYWDEPILIAHLKICGPLVIQCKEQNRHFFESNLCHGLKASTDQYLDGRSQTCSYGQNWVAGSWWSNFDSTYCGLQTIRLLTSGMKRYCFSCIDLHKSATFDLELGGGKQCSSYSARRRWKLGFVKTSGNIPFCRSNRTLMQRTISLSFYLILLKKLKAFDWDLDEVPEFFFLKIFREKWVSTWIKLSTNCASWHSPNVGITKIKSSRIIFAELSCLWHRRKYGNEETWFQKLLKIQLIFVNRFFEQI